jgi:hypothetical protein
MDAAEAVRVSRVFHDVFYNRECAYRDGRSRSGNVARSRVPGRRRSVVGVLRV